MTRDLLGLLLLNAFFVAAGAGLTAGIGWWRGTAGLARSLGVSYLAGLAWFGVVAQLLYVCGASLALWQIVLACAAPAAAVVLGVRRRGEAAFVASHLRLAVPLAVFLLLLAVDLWYQPLWAYDSWTFWTPKAHALYALDGLEPGWFSAADLPNKDYPILLPAVEAAGFRFTGYETSLLDVQSWLVLAAFLRAVFETGAGRARAVVLWAVLAMLVAAPTIADQLASAEADIPEAALFGCAGLCAYTWLVERRRGALVLSSVLAAGAVATKVEGLAFAVALFVVLAALVAARSRSDACRALAAGVGAVTAGIVPWRIWLSEHDIANQASAGRFGLSGLASHAARVPEAAAYLAMKLLDPRAWLLLMPLAVFAVVRAVRSGAHREAAFVAGTSFLAFAGLVLAYWTTPFPLHEHLATSARRVVSGIVFFCAAVTPLVAERREGLHRAFTRPGYPPES